MRRSLWCLALAWALLCGGAAPSAAQQNSAAPLNPFVARVANAWAGSAASNLAALLPRNGRLMLDLGAGSAGPVDARHAEAALRALFGEHETVSVRLERVAIAGGEPLRGFAELAWSSRMRGVTVPRGRVLFVGVVWEGGGWRIEELRLRQ